MRTKIKIKNLDCPNCALELEKEISSIKGVNFVSIQYMYQIIELDLDDESTLEQVKIICNNFEEVKVVDEQEFVFLIKNLDCPNCALELEEEINNFPGIISCKVDFLKQKVYVTCEETLLVEVKNICNNFEDVEVIEENKGYKLASENKKMIILITISLFFFVMAICLEKWILTYFNQNSSNYSLIYWISFSLYLISYLVISYQIFIKTFKNILKGHIFDENFLMTIASIGAILINEKIEGVAVLLLYQIGELLQSIAVNNSRNEIISLSVLQSESANIIYENEIKIIDPRKLKIDDIILVKNGEKVPVDVILLDKAVLDTSSLTGESLPKEYDKNEEVLSGTINVGNVFKAKVIRVYQDSTVSKILTLVEASSSLKANPEKFITKFSKIYTPTVCLLAVIIALIIPTLIGIFDIFSLEIYLTWIYRSLTLLVISCPCALVISIPLSYFNALGACAKNGILVKGATYLDVMSNISYVCYDKTGTLTKGEFKIVSFSNPLGVNIASSLEKLSNHPLAKAFKDIESSIVFDEIEEIAGFGLKGKYNNKEYLVGNYKLLEKENIIYEKIDSISTIIYVSEDKEVIGYIEVDDEVKKESSQVISLLRKMGIKKQIMLTGDNINRANYVANELSLDEAKGELLPQQKLEIVSEYIKKDKVLYIGDGINDAPVMKISSVSISMGKLSSKIALEASDIVLVNDDLRQIPKLIKISKKTKLIVFENIVFALIMKVLFMVLGLLGLPLIFAIFADVGVMLIAVINSLRIRLKGE